MRHIALTFSVFGCLLAVIYGITIFTSDHHNEQSVQQPTSSDGACDCPSPEAARTYVMEQQILKTVTEAGYSTAGPSSMRVSGVDETGRAKVVWLRGRVEEAGIRLHASAYLDQGVTREQILAKLPDYGIDPSRVEEMFLDLFKGYPNPQNIAWYVHERKSNGEDRFEWFEFKTGKKIDVRY